MKEEFTPYISVSNREQSGYQKNLKKSDTISLAPHSV
jgi:hypothetical protein